MGSDAKDLTGPDLAGGLPLGALADRQPFAGHLRGEPVILVKCDGEVFALGAHCSHYGGPLAQGLVVHDEIRCPWHHAAFDLRTGDATRAPALNPIPTYGVTLRDGRVVVGEKRERDPLTPVVPLRSRPDWPSRVVIAGAGAAGSSAAEMLRRLGYSGSIALIDPVVSEPVDRPNLSKDYLAGSAAEDWIPLRPPGFYEHHGIERMPDAVAGLDPAARTISLAGGARLRWDRLLLATGASPIELSVPGGDLPHVRLLRTLEDSRSVIDLAGRARQAVVIGSSFIGMEVAASLAARGLPVRVVSRDRVPFEKTLGSEIGGDVRNRFEARGICFHPGTRPLRITATEVYLDDGTRHSADLVVVGIGVRPRVSLAIEAGLRVHDGVEVDEFLETSHPGIYAAGDIASWPDSRTGRRLRVEHWVVAERQGQTAARNMLGERRRFDAVPFFWTSFPGMDWGLNYVGHADRARQASRRTGRGVTLYHEDGRIRGVATVGNDTASLLAERTLEERSR